MGFGFFPFDFPNPSLSANHPTLIFVPDQMGTHPKMVQSIQVRPLETPTS
jgi:hypothetical protein